MEINKKMTIEEIINVDNGIANILMASGMHCLGCVMASGENLEQACGVHGIDCDELVARINAHLSEKWGN
ncbi:MAG: DUF1858 domain-containing protein [Christensenellaceae bacterium]|nr:DUF1858 domain-containing protein [Christensenellaceae bacterium]